MPPVANKTAATPFLKKITPKTVADAVGLDLMNLQRPVQARTLYDLFGYVIGFVQGATDKGPWVKFKGRFQAVTPDGEVFDSGSTHIPVLEDVLHEAIVSAKEQGDGKARVEIALRIGIKPAAQGKPSATGYEFDVQRLIPEALTADDPIAKLRAEAARVNAALPAPASPAGGVSSETVSASDVASVSTHGTADAAAVPASGDAKTRAGRARSVA